VVSESTNVFTLLRRTVTVGSLDQTGHESITPPGFYRFGGEGVKKVRREFFENASMTRLVMGMAYKQFK